MNEQPQNIMPQPNQAQQQPKTSAVKKPSQHMHDTKTTFLVIISLVFGLLSLVSLFFVLRLRNDAMNQPTDQPEAEVVVENIKPVETNIPDDELDIEKEIFELDKLNLEKIEDFYSDEKLD